MIHIRSNKEIDLLRTSAHIVAQSLDMIKKHVAPGVSTQELDAIIEDFIRSHNARPAFKGFNGFPASSCISIDDQVVHGIPGNRVLKEGEIISIDIGVELNGYYGDAAKTFPVGVISEEKQRLLKVTEESLYIGIEAAQAGNRLSDIGHAIQTHVEKAGYSVVRDLVGHGIGTEMWEEPQIPNYGEPNQGPRLKSGMVFAIEPMVNQGTYQVRTEPDNWTIVTIDGKASAHFEHDIVIQDGKAEILSADL